jgi:hypothetical protein
VHCKLMDFLEPNTACHCKGYFLMLFQKFSKRFYSGECAPVATKYKTCATHTHHACMHGRHTYQMDSNAISKEVKEILLLSVRNSVEEKVCTKVIYPMQTTVCFFFHKGPCPNFITRVTKLQRFTSLSSHYRVH